MSAENEVNTHQRWLESAVQLLRLKITGCHVKNAVMTAGTKTHLRREIMSAQVPNLWLLRRDQGAVVKGKVTTFFFQFWSVMFFSMTTFLWSENTRLDLLWYLLSWIVEGEHTGSHFAKKLQRQITGGGRWNCPRERHISWSNCKSCIGPMWSLKLVFSWLMTILAPFLSMDGRADLTLTSSLVYSIRSCWKPKLGMFLFLPTDFLDFTDWAFSTLLIQIH